MVPSEETFDQRWAIRTIVNTIMMDDDNEIYFDEMLRHTVNNQIPIIPPRFLLDLARQSAEVRAFLKNMHSDAIVASQRAKVYGSNTGIGKL